MSDKIITVDEAAELVRDGDTITTSGFVGIGNPEALLQAVGDRFDRDGHPKDLTLLFAAGQGDGGERGLNRLVAPGLVRRVIGGHLGLVPAIGKRAVEGEIEAYNFPQGVISHLYRDIAAGKPGTMTHVGLETYVDPRQRGGRVNDNTTEELVELVERDGEEWLFYKRIPIDVALLRGTTADERGNITFEREALVIDALSQATAARNCGGVVLVQVEEIVAAGTLPARDVILPGVLVDAVVVAPRELHPQTYATSYSRFYTNRVRAPEPQVEDPPLDVRKVICRRVARELPIGGIVNLGIGMPEGVAAVAREEGLLQYVTLTAEPGVIGGEPASGLDFGAATNIEALVTQGQQFDLYDGGGLDLASLGMAQASRHGDVNVSRFGPKLAGCGGFINISQNAARVAFAGTFTASGLAVDIVDGVLRIREEGKVKKFLEEVEEVTFSGRRAARLGQSVLYVTERCVFRLGEDGIELAEVAPGIDIDKDILALLPFAVRHEHARTMPEALFRPERMELARELLERSLEDRIVHDAERGLLFVDLSAIRVASPGDVDAIEARVRTLCEPLDGPIDAVVNYEHATIAERVREAWTAMVVRLESDCYGRVSRYASGAFDRRRIGNALSGEEHRAIRSCRRNALAALASRDGDDAGV